jgi:uncharacterized protein YhaN
MRLNSLTVESYGHFKQIGLDLSDRSTGVHLVYGPNEAGKTTLKSAIEELLFGIKPQTVYSFAHGYANIVLGGEIEDADGDVLRFTRLKKNRNDLRSAFRRAAAG